MANRLLVDLSTPRTRRDERRLREPDLDATLQELAALAEDNALTEYERRLVLTLERVVGAEPHVVLGVGKEPDRFEYGPAWAAIYRVLRRLRRPTESGSRAGRFGSFLPRIRRVEAVVSSAFRALERQRLAREAAAQFGTWRSWFIN